MDAFTGSELIQQKQTLFVTDIINMKIQIMILVFLFFGGSLSAQTLTDSKMQIGPGPGSYEIRANSEKPIRIPFRMHNGKPLMDVEINGKQATLMIDNGVLWDQIWLFGSPLVTTLALEPAEDSSIEGAGEGDSTRAFTSSSLILKFDDITFYEQPVLVSPVSAGFANMFPGADGQLCNTFFRHFIVEFDFLANEIILHDPDKFDRNREGEVIDLQANASGTWSVPFSFTMLDGRILEDRVDIDFGGIYPLKIALGNTHEIQVPIGAKPTQSFGVQGKTTEYAAKISSMTIGSYRFDDLTAIFGDEKTSRIHPDNLGVIGLPLFMKFNIVFDYFNQRLYLAPNEHFQKPF
jgi:hypothetical protein